MRLRVLLLLLLLATACNQAKMPPLMTNGWHRCPGEELGCYEWEICSPHGCRWWGDPNGPGPGDSAHDGSWSGQTPSR